MRKGQYQREVVERLGRIESNLDKICRELAKIVEQRGAEPAVRTSGVSPSDAHEPDKWLQQGIDNIMGYQARKKRGEGE